MFSYWSNTVLFHYRPQLPLALNAFHSSSVMICKPWKQGSELCKSFRTEYSTVLCFAGEPAKHNCIICYLLHKEASLTRTKICPNLVVWEGVRVSFHKRTRLKSFRLLPLGDILQEMWSWNLHVMETHVR